VYTFESSQLQGKNDLNSTIENVHVFLDDQGHCTYQSVGVGVPELDIRRVEPNSDMLAIWSPVDACDGTAVIVDDQKLRRGPTGCIPQVYRVTQSNGQQVVAPSVEQVEVLVVINKLWCVYCPLYRLHTFRAASEIAIQVMNTKNSVNAYTWGICHRCLAGLVWWEEAATAAETFSGSYGSFLKARIHVRLLSSFSASSLR